jgi:hypothetical protein
VDAAHGVAGRAVGVRRGRVHSRRSGDSIYGAQSANGGRAGGVGGDIRLNLDSTRRSLAPPAAECGGDVSPKKTHFFCIDGVNAQYVP